MAVRPDLPPLTVDALPDAAAPCSRLASLLPKDDWERLDRQACRRASYRCAAGLWALCSTMLTVWLSATTSVPCGMPL